MRLHYEQTGPTRRGITTRTMNTACGEETGCRDGVEAGQGQELGALAAR